MRPAILTRLMILAAFVSLAPAALAEAPKPSLPTVVLLGDSIRLSYAPIVAEKLAGKAHVVSPRANGGDSQNVLKRLDGWLRGVRPDVVHFNCGIHDTKKTKATGKFQVSPEQYAANLRKIVERIRNETGAKIIFATTTPVLDDRAAKARADKDYELLGASVEQYNHIARQVMKQLNVPVDDLHAVVSSQQAGAAAAELIGSDGVHFLPPGQRRLGEAVASFILDHLNTPKN